MTETSFTIDELEELYALFKVSVKVNPCTFRGIKEFTLMIQLVLGFSVKLLRDSMRINMHKYVELRV